ncbi:MAG: hypothetical protein II233_05445 [Clostridia bacterium]|nr:hypothetical protein [Clostridia bacterium]MEE1125608.1 hypothetical protein [Acutalibacteraceae bacterium]
MKNKISVINMVLYIVCAIIWDINLVKCFMTNNSDKLSFVLAVLWTLSATISVIQYVKDKNKINK